MDPDPAAALVMAAFSGDAADPVEIPIENAVTNSSIVQMLYFRSPKIIDYFVRNSDKLLNLALNGEISVRSNRAFNILLECPPRLLDAAAKSKTFTSIARNVLSVNYVNSSLLAKFSSVIFRIMIDTPSNLASIQGCVFQLVGFLSEYSVYSFFVTIFTSKLSLSKVYKAMAHNGFIDLFMAELDDLPFNHEFSYTDPISEKTVNMLLLIPYMGALKTFSEKIRNQRTFNILLKDTGQCSPVIEGRRWGAILALFDHKNIKLFEPAFSLALEQISGPYDRPLDFVVNAISFITKYADKDKKADQKLMSCKIHQIVLRLLYQFPHSSILQNKLYELIKVIIKNKVVGTQFAKSVVPPLVSQAMEREVTALRANSFEIIYIIYEEEKHNKEMHSILKNNSEYIQFVHKILKPRMNTMNDIYGLN